MTPARLATLCGLAIGLLLMIASAMALSPRLSSAGAFEVAVQDQGIPAVALTRTANELGASTVRVVIRMDNPQSALLAAYAAQGKRVQVSLLTKPQTAPTDVLRLMRAWHTRPAAVSVGNEPELNGYTPCGYVRFFRRTSAAIRAQYPGVKIGWGEHSPAGAIEWDRQALACKGPRIRADFWAGHLYQFNSSPLHRGADIVEARYGTYWGIGRLPEIRRFLAARSTRQRLSLPHGGALPIRVTEFAYLITGRYAIAPAQAAAWWPQAILQARRYATQVVLYGFGPVGDASNWGSAPFLTRDGYRTPVMVALAAALGRKLPAEPPLQLPAQPLNPDGQVLDLAPVVTAVPASVEPAPTASDPILPVAVDDPAPAPQDAPIEGAPDVPSTPPVDAAPDPIPSGDDVTPSV